jgi:hypothetical protein
VVKGIDAVAIDRRDRTRSNGYVEPRDVYSSVDGKNNSQRKTNKQR